MFKEFSTAILCGGKSRRMGSDKASLPWEGVPLAKYKWLQFTKAAEEDASRGSHGESGGKVFFSVRDEEQGRLIREMFGTAAGQSEVSAAIPDTIPDGIPGCGPLGGICASLKHCGTEVLFVTAVDMPFSDKKIAEELCGMLTGEIQEEPASGEKGYSHPGSGKSTDNFPPIEFDAAVPVTADGRQHPLCAAYGKSCLPVIEKQLGEGNYKVLDALKRLRVKYVRAEELTDGENKLTNMNDRASYRKAMQHGSRSPLSE